ncbi:MFS transporter [Kiloniella sp.]|uniref:MFS transporter n=1 Tax=Kiloniella sp. TaxID=1938587 RepID=UPI003B02684E
MSKPPSNITAALSQVKQDTPIYLVGLGHGATHWVIATFYFLLPFMARDLGLSYVEAGLFASIFSVASFGANFISGPVVDMTGRRVLWQVVSLLIGAVAIFLMGNASLFFVLVICMVFIGASNNLWHPAAISYLSIRYPERRGFVLSIHALGANLGDAVAPVVMAPVLAALSWRTTMEASVVVPLVVVVLLLCFVGRTGRKGAKVDAHDAAPSIGLKDYLSGVGALLKNRAVMVLCCMSGFRNMAQMGLLVFLPLYLANEMELPPFQMALALFAFQASGLIAAPLAGIWSDKVGRRPLIVGGLGLTTVMLLLITLIDNPTVFVAGISVLGFGLFAIRPVVHSWLMDMTPPHMGGTATSVLFGVQSAMTVFAPIIGGALADRYGLISAFYFLGVALLIANFLVLLIPKKVSG